MNNTTGITQFAGITSIQDGYLLTHLELAHDAVKIEDVSQEAFDSYHVYLKDGNMIKATRYHSGSPNVLCVYQSFHNGICTKGIEIHPRNFKIIKKSYDWIGERYLLG